MKILMVDTHALGAEYGGGQVYIRSLIDGLTVKRHVPSYLRTTFAQISQPQVTRDIVAGVTEVTLGMPRSWLHLEEQARRSRIVHAITELLSILKPDLIHAHGFKDHACKAAELADIPCIVTAHHGGIVCPAGALLNADDTICQIPASDAHCLKCCTTSVPGWQIWYQALRLIPLKRRLWFGERLQRLPFMLFLTPLGTVSCSIRDKLQSIIEIGHTTRIIAPSPAIAAALIRNGIPEHKVVVVPHGIPLPQREPLRSDLGQGPLRFLFIGRISHVKGLHIMLEAFAGLSPEAYELHIVGGAVTRQEQRYLARLKRTFPSVNAVWHGSLPHEEITRYVAWCDVTVHPTICLEVFGLTIAEALAVGRPVLATRCGGAEAQIRDGVNGLLVPPNDAPALRTALQRIIDNPDIIKEMAAQAGDVVSIEQHVTALEKIYTEVIDSQSARRQHE